MRLQDPDLTKVIIVTLAETTPVLEAAGLDAELRRAQIRPWAWVINNSLAAAQTTSSLLGRRAAAEIAQITQEILNRQIGNRLGRAGGSRGSAAFGGTGADAAQGRIAPHRRCPAFLPRPRGWQ